MAFLRRWLGGGEEDPPPAEGYQELTLERLQVGHLVDYDLKTWEVIAYNTLDYDGFVTDEWVLRSEGEVRYLGRAGEDGVSTWTLAWKVGLGEIQEDVAASIAAAEDPPEAIHYQGKAYGGVGASAGLKREGGHGREREFVEWGYESEDGGLLFVSQWGERDFAARSGVLVQEYQFTNILSRRPTGRSEGP